MAKLKDIKNNNKEFVIDLIDLFVEKDPSKTNKYVQFMINTCKKNGFVDWLMNELRNETFKTMFDTIKKFDDVSNRNLLSNSDIYSYKSNEDIIKSIDEANEKVTRKEIKENETIVLYEDSNWIVVKPLTHRSSVLYGKSTKWCTSSTETTYVKYFKQYTENGVLIYVIDKTKSPSDFKMGENIYKKVAFHKDLSNDKVTIWDVKDNEVNSSNTLNILRQFNHIPDLLDNIYTELDNNEPNFKD